MGLLFRKQVHDAQGQRLFGKVTLDQPISISIASMVIILITILMILFLCFANYSRKETVRGYLKPEKGVIRSFSTRNGIIEKIYVSDGSQVTAGDPLILITTSQSLLSGEELSDKLINELLKQNRLLEEDKLQSVRVNSINVNALEQNIATLASSLEVFTRQVDLQREKVGLLELQNQQYKKLRKENFDITRHRVINLMRRLGLIV